MSTEIGAQRFREITRDIADVRGLQRSALALPIAQLLAALRARAKPRAQVPNLLDSEKELTWSDWQTSLEQLARQWHAEHRGDDNPFEGTPDDSISEPGIIEKLRRLVLGCVQRDQGSIAVPPWVMHEVVALLRNGHMFPGAIDVEIRDLIVEAINATSQTSIFCAYDLTVDIALDLAALGAAVAYDTESKQLARLCSCLAAAADLRLRVRCGEPLMLAATERRTAGLDHDTFDAAVVVPPLGVRLPPNEIDTLGTMLPASSSSDVAGVMLAVARSRRVAACLVPPKFLFQNSKLEQTFKERLILDYGLRTVVGLPRGTFGSTAIGAALIVCNPQPSISALNDINVLMIDARAERDGPGPFPGASEHIAGLIRSPRSSSHSAEVGFNELLKNDFNLSVERYVLSDDARRLQDLAASAQTVMLDDLVEFQRPQAIPAPKASTVTATGFEISVSDIDEAGLVRSPSKRIAITGDISVQVRRARLEIGDIVLVIKGSVGKVGFVRDIPDDSIWLASQSFVILRLRRGTMLSDPRVLFRFLSSKLGQAAMQSLRAGTAVPGLQMADVRRLPIVVPDRLAQHQIVEDVEALFDLQGQITHLRGKLAEKQGNAWPEVPTHVPPPPSVKGSKIARDALPHRKRIS